MRKETGKKMQREKNTKKVEREDNKHKHTHTRTHTHNTVNNNSPFIKRIKKVTLWRRRKLD